MQRTVIKARSFDIVDTTFENNRDNVMCGVSRDGMANQRYQLIMTIGYLANDNITGRQSWLVFIGIFYALVQEALQKG